MKRLAAIAALTMATALLPAPAGAWEKMLCFKQGFHYTEIEDGGYGLWTGHGSGSPVEIWYANRDLSTGNDATIRHIYDSAVKEWNDKIGAHATMAKVNIAGDNYAPGTANTDYDFDSVYAGVDYAPGWFTALCDGDVDDWNRTTRRWFKSGNDVRLNQDYMDGFFANDEYMLVAYFANHEIGHAFGLGHENDIPCGETSNQANAVMRWEACPPYWVPGPDGYDGVRGSYPLTPPPLPNPDCPRPIGAGCHVVLPG